jgi:leader peptidase (prepilin peptidase)/N-methyltransferase
MDLAIGLFFGLCIGSFLNVCIARLPLDQSVVSPRSRCPKCKKLIVWYDNIPILSYLWLRASCRHCNSEIAVRYPGIEALTAVVSLLLVLQYGQSPQWGVYLAFSCAMIVLVMIDFDHRILPDVITLNGIWIGVLASVYLAQPSGLAARLLGVVGLVGSGPRVEALTASLLGLVFGGGLLWAVREVFFRIRGIEGMGFGDVKMMAMVGAFLGLPLTLLTIMLGSVVGSVVGLTVIRYFGKSRNYEHPFGTFLGMGAIIAAIYGEAIIRMYLDLMFPASS